MTQTEQTTSLNWLSNWRGLLAAASLTALTAVSAVGALLNSHFNQPGNILIADQFNDRVIETTPSDQIVWQFGLGPNDFSAKSIIGCNDAQRVGFLTLMAGTGAPPGVIPQAVNGVADNGVVLVRSLRTNRLAVRPVRRDGFRSESVERAGSMHLAANAHVLITDQGNDRIIEVNLRKRIVWSYPGSNANASDQLQQPELGWLLENGNILIADENNNRAIEVTRGDVVLEEFSDGGGVGAVAFASRLPNGDTLLTDAGNSRAIEVDATTTPSGNTLPIPTG